MFYLTKSSTYKTKRLVEPTEKDIQSSIHLLQELHAGWVVVLNRISAQKLQLKFLHQEHGTRFNLAETIGNCARHSNHHYQHMVQAIESKGSHNE